jgi:hypothetical protein
MERRVATVTYKEVMGRDMTREEHFAYEAQLLLEGSEPFNIRMSAHLRRLWSEDYEYKLQHYHNRMEVVEEFEKEATRQMDGQKEFGRIEWYLIDVDVGSPVAAYASDGIVRASGLISITFQSIYQEEPVVVLAGF